MQIFKTLLKDRWSIIIAGVLFVTSTGIVPSQAFIVGIILILLSRGWPKNYLDKTSRIMLVIIFLSIINEFIYLLRFPEIDVGFLYLIPYSFFIFLTIQASKVLDERIIRWLTVFFICDVLAAIYQKLMGFNSFFAATASDYTGDMLYNLKVNGFNVNSVGLAYKMLFGLILYNKYPKQQLVNKYVFYCFVAIGIILSFSRTVILSVLIYLGTQLFFSPMKKQYKFLILLIGLVVSIVLIAPYWELIVLQMTRGSENLSDASSGRDEVYNYFVNFILQNPIQGYGSFKLNINIDGILFHAHNSYLQIFANNGVIIGALYMAIILRNLNRNNIAYLFPILFAVFFQNIIFWGLNLYDLLFYKLLLDNSSTLKSNENNTKRFIPVF